MDNSEQLAVLQNDGSYEDAVLSMPDFDDLPEPAPVPAAKPDEDKYPEPKELDEKVVEAPKEEPPATEDDDADYIELPPEKEGEAAARVKVADAVEGWRKAQALETELATVKATANPLPQEIEQELDALTTERGKFINALQDWQARNAPQPPNLALTDPNSPQYNPELFHAQVQNYQRQLGQQRDSQAQLQRLSERQELEEQALTNSRKTREIARLKETWPEVFTPEVGKQVRSDLDKYYGLDDKTIDSVLDSRFFAMAKDALRARAADAKQAEAVKAVKAKPRLVVSQARTKPANSARSDSFSRLQKTGTLDDAADALEGLF